jgi:hypothetical protein
MTDKESEFYGWEQQYGTEEAIRVAAEEWGTSVNQVKILVKQWEEEWH